MDGFGRTLVDLALVALIAWLIKLLKTNTSVGVFREQKITPVEFQTERRAAA